MRALFILLMTGLLTACATTNGGGAMAPATVEEIDAALSCDRLDEGVDCTCVRDTAISLAGTNEGLAIMASGPRVMTESSAHRAAGAQLQRAFAINGLIRVAADRCTPQTDKMGTDS